MHFRFMQDWLVFLDRSRQCFAWCYPTLAIGWMGSNSSVQVQPEFATFFLGFIRGNYNYLNLFHDLNGLDPELYRNLMFLKTYDGGNVEDLCLTFTVAEDAFGANKEVKSFSAPRDLRRYVESSMGQEMCGRSAERDLHCWYSAVEYSPFATLLSPAMTAAWWGPWTSFAYPYRSACRERE